MKTEAIIGFLMLFILIIVAIFACSWILQTQITELEQKLNENEKLLKKIAQNTNTKANEVDT